MHNIRTPVGGLDDIAVAGTLQGHVGMVLKCNNVLLRVRLVRAPDITQPHQRIGVVIPSPALGHQKIIPPVALVQVRPLNQRQLSTGVNILTRADKPPRNSVPLLQRDAIEQLRAAAAASQHVNKPLLTVVVVEQEGVKPGRVNVNRIRPRPRNSRHRVDIVIRVFIKAVFTLNLGIN